MTIQSFWAPVSGRELDATPLSDRTHSSRVVACLNFWNDVEGLKRTVASWLPHVDHTIALDGAYHTTDLGLSTDGSREYLERMGRAHSIEIVDAHGLSQCDKRTMYFERGRVGDMLFIVDADESVSYGRLLQVVPSQMDVGWIRVTSTLYAREYGQPRLIRWMPGLRYMGRHHWIYQNESLLCTHQYGGSGYMHRVSPITIHNNRRMGRSQERLAAKSTNHAIQVRVERELSAIPESQMSDASIGGREALQIVMYAYRDDGLAPSRLHTAINRTTPHSSLFFKNRPGPFGVPDQYLVKTHSSLLTKALASADVVHCHSAMSLARGTARNVWTVFHHHGTLYRTNAKEYNAQAKERNALILLSNLELFSWTDGVTAHYLPNTVPVARYRALREVEQVPWDGNRPFRVAHSPSQPQRKGTDKLVAACERLRAKGLPIELVMIHDKSHTDTLRMKATCHAAFDSFWLGMQCSGIEAAAMGLPVIGGDETVATRYKEIFGYVPYTYAENEEELEMVLRRFVEDDATRACEAIRVYNHIVRYHDESAVALKYLDLLDSHFSWRSAPRKSAVLSQRRAIR